MAGAEEVLANVMLRHLAEIANGRCTITETQILEQTDPKVQEILSGLLFLHEDLEFRQRESERASARLQCKADELERALHDLTNAQEALLQSGKMAAVGQLSAGLAHEINNPIAVILGFAQGLQKRIAERDPFHLPVASIVREALRCQALAQELLTFSRRTKRAMAETDLNALVRSALVLIAPRAQIQGVQIVQDLSCDIPVVWGNATQLQQVLVILCTNALDAMKSGGVLTLRTRRSGQDTLDFEVADTGIGIHESARSRIFEPFFTTKGVGEGTGLGLSLVHEIVEQHEGSIEVESHLGQGTVLRVQLPVNCTKSNPVSCAIAGASDDETHNAYVSPSCRALATRRR